jgi:hypothetical protein
MKTVLGKTENASVQKNLDEHRQNHINHTIMNEY